MSENKPTPVKKVRGPKAAVATFVRSSDSKRIYVFARPGESTERAIIRVKQRNGSAGSEHQLVVQQG
jgi:hypothetical protein